MTEKSPCQELFNYKCLIYVFIQFVIKRMHIQNNKTRDNMEEYENRKRETVITASLFCCINLLFSPFPCSFF